VRVLTEEAAMQRRDFLVTSAMAAVAGSAGELGAQSGSGAGRDYYEWTRYELRLGPGLTRLGQHLRDAYFPALKRQGLGPLGAFTILLGPGSPTLYTLVTLPSLDALGAIGPKLAADAEYQNAASAYLATPPNEAVYVRKESAVLHAFTGMPRIAPPAAAARKAPRVLEFRIYESHNERAGDKKIQMFDEGEIDIFRKTGLTPVFFGQAIAGSPMPSLFYMVTFADVAEREKNWGVFRDHPDWKALSGKPEYANDQILTKTNVWLLRPTDFSQI
jgi:hypothetical protein